MMDFFRKLRQMLCRHDWQTTKFQALVPGIGQQCSKCGKHRRVYQSRKLSTAPQINQESDNG
jgi:hypothetical protein